MSAMSQQTQQEEVQQTQQQGQQQAPTMGGTDFAAFGPESAAGFQETAGNAWISEQLGAEGEQSHGTAVDEDVVVVDDGTYDSQEDNQNTDKVAANAQCNVTALAMMLTALGDDQDVHSAAVALVIEKGSPKTEEELAEWELAGLLMERFELWGNAEWETCADENADHFWNGWHAYWLEQGKPWNQVQEALAWVAMEFEEFVGETSGASYGGSSGTTPFDNSRTEEELYSADYYLNELAPLMKQGSAIMLGTRLTPGHVVALKGIRTDGILANDPNGINIGSQGRYVLNGELITKHVPLAMGDRHSVVKSRLTYNQDILGELMMHMADIETTRLWEGDKAVKDIDTACSHELGEDNFYTWDEVKRFSIGKWNMVAGQKE